MTKQIKGVKVYICYMGDGDTCTAPLAVFSREADAMEWRVLKGGYGKFKCITVDSTKHEVTKIIKTKGVCDGSCAGDELGDCNHGEVNE
jgi:hypothetical protein